MKTHWFTFGQDHQRTVNGILWDKDCVCEITAEDPRDVMQDHFGQKWSMEHTERPDMRYYPRGIIELAAQ